MTLLSLQTQSSKPWWSEKHRNPIRIWQKLRPAQQTCILWKQAYGVVVQALLLSSCKRDYCRDLKQAEAKTCVGSSLEMTLRKSLTSQVQFASLWKLSSKLMEENDVSKHYYTFWVDPNKKNTPILFLMESLLTKASVVWDITLTGNLSRTS